MQFRKFGKLDWDVSVLGFGCMRFPTNSGSANNIDEEKSLEMLYKAIDNGVNYLDTAYPYHGGASEPFVGKAMKNGYRQKVRVATKMPSWLINSEDDFDKYLNEQLERLQVEHIDFYLLHALNKKWWEKYQELNVFDWAEKAKADGRIGQLGFSFHDNYEVYSDILNGHDWDFVQLQYNYMDVEHQAGFQGVEDAAEKGIPVVVMEPLLGGSLAKEPPENIQRIWDEEPVQRTAADWALQWVWDNPAVATVLSGMSAMQHVEENIASASKSGVRSMTAAEHAAVEQVREIYTQIRPINCTSCEYCLPCPEDLNIPALFGMLNNSVMYDSFEGRRSWYKQMGEPRADMCTQCETCVELCPQLLQIPELMEIVHSVMGEDQPFTGIPTLRA